MSTEENTTVRGRSNDLPLSKIFWGADDRIVQITLSNHYGGENLGILNRMFDVACRDFPEANLESDSVSAVALGGDRRKHMWGIEFKVPAGTKIPEGYEEIQSEPILSGGL